MSETHWKTMMDNTYIGVYDFKVGEYKNLKIINVKQEKIPPKNDERPVIYFQNEKPMVCNATNGRTIENLLKTPIIENWIGHTITLYADMTVRSPGQRKTDVPTGGVRVFNQLPKVAEPKKCHNCGKEIKGVEIKGKQYTAEQIAKSSNGLCYPCYVEVMKKQKEMEEQLNTETDN